MDKLVRGIPDDLVESLQELANLHRRSLNAEILVALQAYAEEESRVVKYKETNNLDDIWALRHQFIDGKIIVTAWILGRTVHVLNIDENELTGQKFIVASWHGWPKNHIIDVNPENNIEFKIYTERQYAAMMDALREKEGKE